MGRHRRQLQTYPPSENSKRCNRKQAAEDSGGVGCSGKSCNSCTGRVIADCVAVCCCPCAVVNFFTLTFLKLPWIMGRKCLAKKKKKKKLKNNVVVHDQEMKKDDAAVIISRNEIHDELQQQQVENIIMEEEEEGISGGKDRNSMMSGRFEEAERVWLELYKVDNLGFGRVSFSGIQSLAPA